MLKMGKCMRNFVNLDKHHFQVYNYNVNHKGKKSLHLKIEYDFFWSDYTFSIFILHILFKN